MIEADLCDNILNNLTDDFDDSITNVNLNHPILFTNQRIDIELIEINGIGKNEVRSLPLDHWEYLFTNDLLYPSEFSNGTPVSYIAYNP